MRPKLACFYLLLPCLASASELKVVEGVVTTGIVECAPVDIVQAYPATAEKLYCYTE